LSRLRTVLLAALPAPGLAAAGAEWVQLESRASGDRTLRYVLR